MILPARVLSAFGLVVFGFSSLACQHTATADGASDLDTQQAALLGDTQDDATASDQESNLQSVVGGVSADDVKDVASAKADWVTLALSGKFLRFSDPACVKSERKAPASVVHHLTACTGPYGRVAMNGDVTLTFAKNTTSPGSLVVDVVSDVTYNGLVGVQKGTATVSVANEKRTIVWDGTYTGKTASGLAVTRTVKRTTEIDASTGCFTLSGDSTTTVAARELDVKITGYARCGGPDVCPRSGTVQATRPRANLTTSLTYEGGGKATLTGPAGRSYDVSLRVCNAE